MMRKLLYTGQSIIFKKGDQVIGTIYAKSRSDLILDFPKDIAFIDSDERAKTPSPTELST